MIFGGNRKSPTDLFEDANSLPAVAPGIRQSDVGLRNKPKPSDTPLGVGPKWVEGNEYVTQPVTLESSLKVYGKKKRSDFILGTQLSVLTKTLFGELM